MLKFTYTEDGFHLEHLTQSLEDWVKNRALVLLRAGVSFWIEPSTAAFLLPADLPHLTDLETLIHKPNSILELSICDAESVEVSLQGTWVASEPESEAGVFVTTLGERHSRAFGDRAEFFVYQLWLAAQDPASVVKE